MLTPRTWVSAASSVFEILLEVFHLLRSTTGKGEDIERQNDVFLAPVVAQIHFFQVGAVEVCSVKSGAMSPTFGMPDSGSVLLCALATRGQYQDKASRRTKPGALSFDLH